MVLLPDLPLLLDHSLLHPQLSEDGVLDGCKLARAWGVASVLVRPADADVAVRTMDGSSTTVGAAVDFPHGHGTTTARVYAVRDCLRRGVREIETPLNLSKLLSRQFQHVETELRQMADACRESKALLKVRLGSGLNEESRFLVCRIVKRAGVDFVVLEDTSETAFFHEHLQDRVRIKACGFADTKAALAAQAAGVARIEGDTAVLMAQWRERLNEKSQPLT